jgi:Permeases of the major facilitator superfamily
LPEIAAPHELGRISGIGWAIGSAGGIIILLIILPLVIMIKGTFIVRLSFIITALFFAFFAAPIFMWLKERALPQALPTRETYWDIAVRRLSTTIHEASKFREFVKFVIAFLIYNDAIIMALDFSAIIGAVLFGMNQQQLILFFILVQATNVVGAYLFGLIADEVGYKPTLIFSILMMIAIVIALYFTQSMLGFLIIGALAGIGMAGVQSLSRTMVGAMAPPGRSAEFYGFFAVAGRTSSFIGPAVYGFIAAEMALWFQQHGLGIHLAEQQGQRVAILSIAFFLFVGLIILLTVNERVARSSGVEKERIIDMIE